MQSTLVDLRRAHKSNQCTYIPHEVKASWALSKQIANLLMDDQNRTSRGHASFSERSSASGAPVPAALHPDTAEIQPIEFRDHVPAC